jgi:hypothetical protein
MLWLWEIALLVVIVGTAVANRYASKNALDSIRLVLGLIGSFIGIWSGINWLFSAQLAVKLAQGAENKCKVGDVNCLSQVQNLWAAEAALVAAICVLGLWNADNLGRFMGTRRPNPEARKGA